MGVITNIRAGLRFRYLYLIFEAIKKIVNWPIYFLDLFSLSIGKFTIFDMKNSLKYMVRSRTCDRGIITTVHLADEYNIDQLRIPGNSTVVDIGAYIGIFSVYISQKAGKIFVYEPISESFDILNQNIKINNLEKKIKAFNYAISDNREKIKIYFSKTNTSAHSMYGNDNCNYYNDYQEVPTLTLKEVFDTNNIGSCELLKVDTEGAEYKILYGLPNNYFKRIKRIYLEHHNIHSQRDDYNCNALKEYLEKNGYKVKIVEHIMFAEQV